MTDVIHTPGPISKQQVGVQGPDNLFAYITIAIAKCTCGNWHAALDEHCSTYGTASFWLGVKFAQLNKWTELTLPFDLVDDGGDGG